jgi:CzcA family heavy metal efflux pump
MNLLDRMEGRRGALVLLALILAGAGALLAPTLPSAIFPDVTFPIIKVISDAGEEPAARVMPTVTRPLEEAIHRVPGVQRILSATSRGSTEITAHFLWGTEMMTALQRVQGEVERIRPDLPQDLRVEVQRMNTATFPVLGYTLTSDTASQADLWELAEYRLKPSLLQIPGVSQIQVQGGRKREFQVRLRNEALTARKLQPDDIVSAIKKNNQVLSAGLVEKNHELYLSLVDGRADGLRALSDISVPVAGGVPARLGDLGTLAADNAVSYIRTTADGRPAVLVNVVQQPTANTLTISAAVDGLFASHPEILPPGVKWGVFYDQAAFIRESVTGVRDAIAIGVALGALVLLVFLRDFRTTLVAVATIPLSVALVLLCLAAAQESVNLMTLGAIAASLGLVVDDAIVVVEHIHRRRREGEASLPRALGEMLPALLGSSLSTIVVFVPFALLTGVTGAFFKPLALTMVISLATSFLLATFVVPAALGVSHRDGARTAAEEGGGGPIAYCVRRPLIAVSLTVLLLGGGYVLLEGFGTAFPGIGTDFLPEMDEGSIILDYFSPPGTSLTDTDAMLQQAEKVILSLSDVEAYSRRTGTQLGFFITEPNRGDYVIKLKPRSKRRAVDEVIDDLRTKISAVEPALHIDFGQILEDNIGDLTGGVPQPIDVKIFGEDQTLLQQKADRAAEILKDVKGVEDIFDGIVIAGPALSLKVDPTELARYGLTTEEIHAAVEPALTGTVASNIRIQERIYDVRVFAGQGEGFENLRLRSSSGALLPLLALARVETGPPEAEIDRDNLQTYLGVTARLTGRDLGGAVAEIRHRLERDLHLPNTMSFDFGGLYEQQQSGFKGLLGVLLAGLLLVSVVILFEFGDLRAPLLTALMAVLVLTGVFAALRVSGMTLNISSFVGAIMMVGIVGENCIFVIHEARSALRSGLGAEAAWTLAARRRLRPVLMTILATGFALSPLAIALGQGSQLQQPLAIAVIGGFVLSGPLVLLVLPSLYLMTDPRGRLGA